MTEGNNTTSDHDFYAEVTAAIEAKKIDGAVEMIMALPKKHYQFEVLSRLAHELVELFASMSNMDNALANAHELASAIDLADSLTRARARAVSVALSDALVDSSSFALTDALDCANGLASVTASTPELARADAFTQTILRGLKLVIEAQPVLKPTAEETPVENPYDTFQFTFLGIDTLTPIGLASIVAPYLQAILDLQRSIAHVQNAPYLEPKIGSISTAIPIEVKLVDVMPVVIDVFVDTLIPWRRRIKDVMVQIADDLSLGALKKAKLEFIETIFAVVDKHIPDLQSNDRLAVVVEISKTLDTMATSQVEILNVSTPKAPTT